MAVNGGGATQAGKVHSEKVMSRMTPVDDSLPRIALEDQRSLDVGTKTLTFAAETTKLNPNSLRFLLGFLLVAQFQGNRSLAVKSMKDVGGVYASTRPDRDDKRMNNKVMGAILNDETYITYWHIEAFARQFRLPAGAILILSRVMALVRDKKIGAATDLASGLRRFADVLDSIIEKRAISKSHLEKVQECFAPALRQEQPNLFDRGPPI